jgi:2-polyprenyl-3-methyl-5-hydroxy-6-metoxy-1,4-benzoquinol methylase
MGFERDRFERFVVELSGIDRELSETTAQLERSWATGQARDAELTEYVTTILEGAIEKGIFSLPTMAQGFNAFAHEFRERQVEFLRTGAYRARDYAEVSREVYSNEEFMRSVYYPALLFSYLGSPNYRHILRRLDETLGRWRQSGAKRLLEVASGHAFLILFSLTRIPEATGVGTDIAAAASLFAASVQEIVGVDESRFRFAVTDLLERCDPAVGGPFDGAICCELLEHVPHPGRFLRAIHDRLAPNGRLFVSAAVRMESVDHLTLFRSMAEVRELLAVNGFEVVEEMSVPFVARRPRDRVHWERLLNNPLVAATFVADCRRTS